MNEILGVAWENIFIGLLGGALVSGIGVISAYIKNKNVERRYPIKGDYITVFEDKEDDKIVNTTALARLKQNGKKIVGDTWLSSNRKWILEGTLTDKGHLHGVYYAEDPLDEGVGNFFLKVSRDRSMIGLWSGYDSVNGIINSGKYLFTPIIKEYTVANMETKHISQVLSIADDELGKKYLDVSEISTYISEPDKYICKVVFDESGAVLGFCINKILTTDELVEYLKLEQYQLPNYIKYAQKVGVIKTVAIKEKIQKHGIGYELLKCAYKDIVDSGVQGICSVAWKNGDKINIGSILLNFGFRQHYEIKNYWAKDSEEQQFSCPVCGDPPCKCSAVMYFKAV